jgi:methionine synthase II (cobalamin-independent)
MSKRFQIVGSLLRPANLLAYKKQIESRDDIKYPFYDDFEGYEKTEYEAIKYVVNKQIEEGLSIISDGEYSKSLWHLDFVWGFSGVRRFIAKNGYFFRDFDETCHYETRRDIGLSFEDKLSGKNHHFIHIYKKLQQLAGDHPIKLCIPSPSHIFGERSFSGDKARDISSKELPAYASQEEFKTDIIRSYKEFLQEYANIGGKIIQFDDCLWEMFADDNPNSPFTGKTPEDHNNALSLANEFVAINNEVIDFGHSLNLQVWTHNCRGNYDSRHMGGGSYEKIANIFLKNQKYDRFFLEWDDDRAGSLEALKAFENRPETSIVLGLLSSKTSTLDNEERVLKLLEEASKIIPKERLYLSHQCGFASCDGGNHLTEEQQWAKIAQGQKIAQAYWGE